MTIVSLLVVLWLAWGEWSDWRTVVIKPELIVDKGRGMRHLQPPFNLRTLTIVVVQASAWRSIST